MMESYEYLKEYIDLEGMAKNEMSATCSEASKEYLTVTILLTVPLQ